MRDKVSQIGDSKCISLVSRPTFQARIVVFTIAINFVGLFQPEPLSGRRNHGLLREARSCNEFSYAGAASGGAASPT